MTVPVLDRVPTVVCLVDVAFVRPIGRRVESLCSRESELRVGVRLILWILGDSLVLVRVTVAVSFVLATPPVDERLEGVLWGIADESVSWHLSVCG